MQCPLYLGISSKNLYDSCLTPLTLYLNIFQQCFVEKKVRLATGVEGNICCVESYNTWQYNTL